MKVQSLSLLSANNNINIQKSKVNSYSNNISNSIQNSAINFQHKNVLNNTTKNSIRALVLALGMQIILNRKLKKLYIIIKNLSIKILK